MSAGFHEPHIAALAAQLEFGNLATDLPERPAFRMAKDDALEAGRDMIAKELKGQVRSGDLVIPDDVAQKAADAMATVIQRSYVEFDSPGLSERQRRRKVGTLGQAKVLIGHKGPRLISHIRGKVR